MELYTKIETTAKNIVCMPVESYLPLSALL